MTGKKTDAETHPQHGGVPEPVDESEFLTRPVFGGLLAEVEGKPGKLQQLRLLVSERAELTPGELQEEIGKVYGRHVTLTETVNIIDLLSHEEPSVIVKAEEDKY